MSSNKVVESYKITGMTCAACAKFINITYQNKTLQIS